MKRLSKLYILGILLIATMMVASCSPLTNGIKGLFASKTPTSTNTPTPTPTSTTTPTPTKTPLPPIQVDSCPYLSNCPIVVPLDDLLGFPANPNATNKVDVPFNQTVNVSMDWTVLDSGVLDETAPYVKWIFTIDGQDYFNQNWVVNRDMPDSSNPAISYPALWLSVNMSGWKVGETHVIQIGLKLERAMSDGWVDLPEGHTYVKTYLINPVPPPTATPTATSTNTPRPRPTAIPYTKTPKPTPLPACDASYSINIENNTGAYVTLYMKGPTSYKFNLVAGNSTIKVCPGSYSTTAYGCGGASKSDHFDSNSSDTITYSCY